MLYIAEKAIIGQKFTSTDPKTDPKIEFTCVGYAQNDTCLIVGAHFDSVNNRTELKTIKMTDAKFKGDLSTSL